MKKYNRLFKYSILLISSLIIYSLLQSWENFLPFKHDPLSGPFPYHFRHVQSLENTGLLHDINHNGKVELVTFLNDKNGVNTSRVLLHDENFSTIDQINFDGILQRPYFFDYTNDGIDEVAVPYTRNDTLFLRLISYSKRPEIIKEAALYSGKPRTDSSRVYPWRGRILDLQYLDLDSDGSKELIVFPHEGLAQSPRGVMVFDGKKFRIKWRYLTAPMISEHYIIGDFNKNGKAEFILPTASVSNGNRIGERDDFHGYLYYVEYGSDRAMTIKPYGGAYSGVAAALLDYDGDQLPELYTLRTCQQSTDQNMRLDILNIDPKLSSKENLSRTLRATKGRFICTKDEHNADILLVLEEPNTLSVLDKRLNVIRRERFPFTINNIRVCPDLDGDGKKEIFILISGGTIFLVDHHLRLRAKIANKYFLEPYQYSGIQLYYRRNARPLLAFYTERDTRLMLLEKKSFYLLQHYGPRAALLGIVFTFLFLLAYSAQTVKKIHSRDRLIEDLSDLIRAPFLYMDAGCQIRYVNKSARKLLRIGSDQLPGHLNKIIPEEHKILLKHLRSLESRKGLAFETEFKMDGDPGEFVRLSASPFRKRRSKRNDWLILLINVDRFNALQHYQTWNAMAQRVAHDIKNPLTSIQLTVQRLQREYYKLEPENAKHYEPYVNRILTRIDVLKKMSRDFMKFINVAKPNKQLTDLNNFMEKLFSDGSIEIPKDITLNRDFSADLPTLHIDQEQFRTLIENLVSNSINAMPDGGTLTVTAGLALKLQFDEKPMRDYFVLEVMDTGVGISPDIQGKLFQPFTTDSYLGTGLGLAIVKKIVDDHDGHIEVNSEADVGTSFIIYIPVA